MSIDELDLYEDTGTVRMIIRTDKEGMKVFKHAKTVSASSFFEALVAGTKGAPGQVSLAGEGK